MKVRCSSWMKCKDPDCQHRETHDIITMNDGKTCNDVDSCRYADGGGKLVYCGSIYAELTAEKPVSKNPNILFAHKKKPPKRSEKGFFEFKAVKP